jgi:hypothetical protein
MLLKPLREKQNFMYAYIWFLIFKYQASRSRVIRLINWYHVARLYLPMLWYLIIAVLLIQIASLLHSHSFDFKSFWSTEVVTLELGKGEFFYLGWKTLALVAILGWVWYRSDKPVYLIDFTCFEPPRCWRVTSAETVNILKSQGCFTEDSMKFMEKILSQSGVGDETAWPPTVSANVSESATIENARRESETVMFDCVRKLLKRTNTKAKDIDILVINCSLFSPTPSLCSMVINEFGMRSDVSSYNLSGMVSLYERIVGVM